ncbi:MAG: nucleotide exchange factor GrpE [Verrucomicrobiales bacterium]
MSQSNEPPPSSAPASSLDDDWEVPAAEPDAADPAPSVGVMSPDALQAELTLWKDTALRARADLDNFRKRMTQEAADTRRFANASLLEELLPIIDNFQFGLQAAEGDAGAKNLLVGLNMVAGQLQSFLRDQGAEEVPAVGRPFDPNIHEAVGQQSSGDVPEGTVISQVRRGFRLRDRLLRPATVIVSTGPEAKK